MNRPEGQIQAAVINSLVPATNTSRSPGCGFSTRARAGRFRPGHAAELPAFHLMAPSADSIRVHGHGHVASQRQVLDLQSRRSALENAGFLTDEAIAAYQNKTDPREPFTGPQLRLVVPAS